LPYLRCGQLSFGGHVDPLALKQIKLKVIKKLMIVPGGVCAAQARKKRMVLSGKTP
jgi:hypothetical protein